MIPPILSASHFDKLPMGFRELGFFYTRQYYYSLVSLCTRHMPALRYEMSRPKYAPSFDITGPGHLHENKCFPSARSKIVPREHRNSSCNWNVWEVYSATSPPMKYYEFSPSIIYLMTSLYIICFWHSSETWVECFKVKCSLILFPGSCFLPLL